MAFICKLANLQHQIKVVSDVSRIVAFLLFLAYFGLSQVRCGEEIQFCKNALKTLQKDEKYWRKKCLKPQLLNSSCCEAERKNLRERKCVQSRVCFNYKSNYQTNYILLIKHFVEISLETTKFILR